MSVKSKANSKILPSSTLPNGIDLSLLSRLLMFSSKYQLSIQFWPDQTAVYIYKDFVELKSFGGDFGFAIGKSIEYLERIQPLKEFKNLIKQQ
jgi:hypothetical protein